MRRRSILVVAVAVCLMSALGQAGIHTYVLGDDDGFGLGSPVAAGDEISVPDWGVYAHVADGDGTDELIPGARDPQDFVFAYDAFSSITASSLFVQYIDWPESQPGFLWIDDHRTSFAFPSAGWDQESPWDVLAVTIDLTPYADYLYDGQVVFNLLGENTDAYIVDYMKLSVDGSLQSPPVNPVPLPGSVLLGVWAVGLVGWWRRRQHLDAA